MTTDELQLQLRLLGPPEALAAGQPLAFPTRKTLALLAFLALAEGPQPREQLATLLWPEASPERSRASLRNTLNHLQNALRGAGLSAEPGLLAITHGELALSPAASIEFDLRTAERAYARARADRASRSKPGSIDGQPLLQAGAAAYRGDFLAGFSLGDAPAFDDWADMQREAWRRRVSLILDRLSELQFAAGEFAATAETASVWISLDSLNEAATRRKMRAHFAAGERGQALEAYNACRDQLAAELHTEPDPATEALAARVRSQTTPEQRAPALPVLDTPEGFLGSMFSGREKEQQLLWDAYSLVADGQPQVVTLRGETGIGKTRLAEVFLTRLREQGGLVLPGSSYEGGTRLPFQPLAQALRIWLHRESDPLQWADEADLAPLSELLPELRERIPGLPALAGEIPFTQAQFFEAFVRLTLTLAEQAPLVLFVDDLQWADNATLDLLQYTTRRWHEARRRTLLLVSMRSDTMRVAGQAEAWGLPRWLKHMEREAAPRHVDLTPLSEADTLALLAGCLTPPAPDFAHWLFNETHGHPFYLIESLKDLVERGALVARRTKGASWQFALDSEHDLAHDVRVPSTVGTVVRARLQRLSPNAFAMLVAGATLNHEMTFERLSATANVPEAAALPALDELVSRRLLLEGGLAAVPGSYTFPNEMIRDVVYTEAGDARRRLFHQRALDVLRAAHGPAAVLAHHAYVAGRSEDAFQHSLEAGRAALRISAADDALIHFERARSLACEALAAGVAMEVHVRGLYEQLGRAYELGGQPKRALAVLAELDRLTLT